METQTFLFPKQSSSIVSQPKKDVVVFVVGVVFVSCVVVFVTVVTVDIVIKLQASLGVDFILPVTTTRRAPNQNLSEGDVLEV